jgi:hypothetical protein
MDAKIEKLARALYDELEDQNYHSFCALLNWMFNLYTVKYYGDCIRIKDLLENHKYNVNVRAEGDNVTNWEIRKFKMVVNFKEVKKK